MIFMIFRVALYMIIVYFLFFICSFIILNMINCFICNTRSDIISLQPIGNCENHLICDECYQNYHKHEKVIKKCKECKIFFNFESESFFSKLFDSKGKCKYCSSKENLCQLCEKHSPCRGCLLTNVKNSKNLSKIKDCVLCIEILKKSCRSCFYPLDPNQQIKNPSCKIHFYCKECFLTFPADLKCSECQNFYMHPSQNKCLSCKISCPSTSPHHDNHFLCSICTIFFNNSSKETLDIILKKITCQKCVQTFRNKESQEQQNPYNANFSISPQILSGSKTMENQ